ncbi:MFS transporter [Kitasatospora purpeofusca]|uniref:MFS transporter n=1 Tax=Kitasatospora purpeofusca TaxID=67352 RepID=UPI0036D2AEBB
MTALSDTTAPPRRLSLLTPGLTRTLGIANLCRTTSSGILLSTTLIYLSRSLHLNSATIGLGFGAAAVLAMLVSVPGGAAADRWGAKRVTTAAVACQGVLTACYTVVGDTTGFLLVACPLAALGSAAGAAAGSLVADAVPQADRTALRALMRSVGNTGLAVGALIGGAAVQLDREEGFLALFLAACALQLVAAAGYWRLPVSNDTTGAAPGPRARPRTRSVLRDRPVVALVGAGAALSLNQGVLNVVLPLWVATDTSAPHSVYSAVLLVNAVGVILFQVRVSRRIDCLAAAGSAQLRSGLLFGACCLLFMMSAHVPPWAAVAALLLGSLVHVLGELRQQAGMWTISYAVAPPGRHGEYQGLFQTSSQLADVVAPAVGAVLIATLHEGGWLVLGALMLVPGLFVPALLRRVPPVESNGAE